MQRIEEKVFVRMEKNNSCGGLVDFKENLIFEKEKDRAVENSEKFKSRISKEYGVNDNLSDLYIRIVNYQIEKYGETLTNNCSIPPYYERVRLAVNAKKRRKNRLK